MPFVVTAPTSPSNSICLQNIMSYMDKGNVLGAISTDIGNNPAALNAQSWCLRACDMIYSAAGYYMWDLTNSPTGNFALQNGKRRAWGYRRTDHTHTFYANDIWFRLSSSDAANSMLYAGNLATNTADGTLLTFSSTLRGQVLDAQGNVVADYHNGESILTHPVNRIYALIREGYYVTDQNSCALAANYFKSQMTLTNFAAFYMADGTGATNSINSRPYPIAHAADANGNKIVTCQYQRQLGLNYSLLMTTNLRPPEVWTTVETGMSDGGGYTNTTAPLAFFRAVDPSFVNSSPSVRQFQLGPPIAIIAANGPE